MLKIQGLVSEFFNVNNESNMTDIRNENLF